MATDNKIDFNDPSMPAYTKRFTPQEKAEITNLMAVSEANKNNQKGADAMIKALELLAKGAHKYGGPNDIQVADASVKMMKDFAAGKEISFSANVNLADPSKSTVSTSLVPTKQDAPSEQSTFDKALDYVKKVPEFAKQDFHGLPVYGWGAIGIGTLIASKFLLGKRR